MSLIYPEDTGYDPTVWDTDVDPQIGLDVWQGDEATVWEMGASDDDECR